MFMLEKTLFQHKHECKANLLGASWCLGKRLRLIGLGLDYFEIFKGNKII